MTQYNILNVKLSSSQPNKLKFAMKNKTETVLRLSWNMIGDDETNFPHKLLWTNRQVANLRKACQKLKYLRWYNQEEFLVDFLAHY